MDINKLDIAWLANEVAVGIITAFSLELGHSLGLISSGSRSNENNPSLLFLDEANLDRSPCESERHTQANLQVVLPSTYGEATDNIIKA